MQHVISVRMCIHGLLSFVFVEKIDKKKKTWLFEVTMGQILVTKFIYIYNYSICWSVLQHLLEFLSYTIGHLELYTLTPLQTEALANLVRSVLTFWPPTAKSFI